MRIDYQKVAPAALAALSGARKYLADCSIPSKLRFLIDLRVSQLNGCAYCVDMHNHEARVGGETQQRLDCLSVWRETDFYSAQERAAFRWAEEVTQLSPGHVSDEAFEEACKYFSEPELVDLTAIIASMNALNRLAISLRKGPAIRH